jgi:hypothetical protein
MDIVRIRGDRSTTCATGLSFAKDSRRRDKDRHECLDRLLRRCYVPATGKPIRDGLMPIRQYADRRCRT